MGVDGESADIYRKYRDDLLRYATSLVGPSMAEDAVSAVVLRTIRRQSLSEIEKPKAYLMKGVLNEARSLMRRRSIPPLEEDVESYQPVEVLETLEAVGRLPVRQRAATFLFYWEDRSIDEIADLMGIRPGTVKRYLFNARRRLRKDLE
jgi:RNA polymerase sigma factor (sigma-70 family)